MLLTLEVVVVVVVVMAVLVVGVVVIVRRCGCLFLMRIACLLLSVLFAASYVAAVAAQSPMMRSLHTVGKREVAPAQGSDNGNDDNNRHRRDHHHHQHKRRY